MNTAWDFNETQRLMEHPAVRLLRSQNAALTLAFLHRAFKEHHAITVPESHLRARLDNFLDEARARRPGAYAQTAAEYLASWCGSEQLLLKKLYSNEAEEPVFELTTAAERAMQWLDDLQSRPFVSAESRLELIFRQLEEIVLYSTPDASRRVEALRAQQAELQAQIDAVQATNTAEAYTAVQLTERFANALDLARGLAADFRQLEENFKEVARALAEAQTKPGATKGRIVGQLLDTHAALKGSSQGQSFYAFWNLLSSPERQQRWRELTRQVYRLDMIDEAVRSNRLLDRLSSRLLVEGERVVRSNERMAATLRRALESAATGEDRRLREAIRETQQLALACRHAPPPDDDFFQLIGPPNAFTTFTRSFWQPDVTGHSAGDLTFAIQSLDWDVVQRFRGLVDLHLARLRDQIRVCLVADQSVLLSQVLARFPPREGILEVVGYLVVAMQDTHNYLPGDQFADVQIPISTDTHEQWRVPEVLFTRTP
ncbi:MAG TPA: DUF3375 domain-containing protein [Burkholderiales bacterium]|nr:DUF3375 domain-containing protein [Burkholderiales bacterium]